MEPLLYLILLIALEGEGCNSVQFTGSVAKVIIADGKLTCIYPKELETVEEYTL